MLVLSRKAGEAIRLGDDIVITIERISGNKVSIGIHAPDDVKVLRQELLDQAKNGPVQPRLARRA